MARNLIREVTAKQLDARAKKIARSIGVPSEGEAYALLERGDLNGTWAEVELKLVRHLRGQSHTSLPPIAAE